MLASISSTLVAYGWWGVLLIGFLDSLGVPLPAVLDVLLIGIAIQAPDRAYLAAAMAVLGSLAGNLVLFLAAAHGSRRLVRSLQNPGRSQRFRQWFQRYGLITVFIPAAIPLLPLPLKIFVISAGVLHASPGRVAAVILCARLLRYFTDAYLGVRLGSGAQAFLTHNKWTLAAIALGLAVALMLAVRRATRDSAA